MKAGVATYVLRLTPKEVRDVAVTEAAPSVSIANPGQPVEIRAEVRSKGPATTRWVEFFVDDVLRHKEQVVSREMLARYVWKETGRATPLDNVMDVHINRLRRKVDEPFDRKLIHTVRGVGFVLREEQ